jgi:glycosyltransferase involved in cell wall biosynthesis
MTSVSICVATYERPNGLRRLLEGLAGLRFEKHPAPEIEVLVIDNESAGRAAIVCDAVRPRFPWRLEAFEEPRRGITYARNRGLLAVRAEADFIAFIDDDEVPDPGWLDALLRAQARFDSDVVTGPVYPRFELGVPRWIERGRFFGPRQHPDGHSLEVAFTNNVLLRASLPRELGRMFDHQFALTGGEDTDFFMRAHRAGYRIVWAAEAVVHEFVPASRTTVGWLLRRGYREWGSHSRCERVLYPSMAVRAERVLKASTLVVSGLASLPITALMGRHHLVRSLLTTARGLGSLAGLLGHHYAEYRDPASGGDGGSAYPPSRVL